MEGRIYISRVFTTVNRLKCGGSVGWIDNDPHFWTMPPTWGICRTDYRRTVQIGDHILFVLSKQSELPQMIYGYFRIHSKVTHVEAYIRPGLRSKRMGRKNPNGNIIVDAHGHYNRYDGGVHRSRFDQIKQYYVIGDTDDYEFLTEPRIRALAPQFVATLNRVFDTRKDTPFGVIGRSGRRMNESQVQALLHWLRS